jgi:hypothetical protein
MKRVYQNRAGVLIDALCPGVWGDGKIFTGSYSMGGTFRVARRRMRMLRGADRLKNVTVFLPERSRR